MRRLPFLLALTALAACAADPDVVAGDEQPLVAYAASAKPVAADDFATPLTKTALRTAHALPADAFAARWEASLADPVLFLRAWPAAFHKDLAQVPVKRLLGGEGLCVGDAHPGNFGFVRFGSKTRYVYNDLDDSGYCPVAIDAARYFAAVRVFWDDGDVLDEALEAYVDAVKDAGTAQALDAGFAPDWAAVREKELADATQGETFVMAGELGPVSAATKKAVLSGVSSHPLVAGKSVLSVAALDRKSGGSGGLDRYWLLVAKGSSRTIVECKEAASPGTEAGRNSKKLAPTQRLAILKAVFWNDKTASDNTYVTIAGRRFLVRDRLARKSLDVLNLDKKDRRHVLAVQAGILAGLHAPRWSAVKKDEMRSWLKDTSKTLAKRWLAAYDVAQ